MSNRIITHALIGAAALALLPASAVAQNDIADRAKELAEQAEDVQEEAGALANEVNNRRVAEEAALQGTDSDANGEDVRDDDDDDFPWGLLGLLGLAGLLGLRRDRNDRARRDIHP